jgi:DNA mismatch repair protein MutS2
VREVKEGELTREKTLKVKEFLANLEASVQRENGSLEREEQLLAEERRSLESEDIPAADRESGAPIAAGAEVLAGESRRRGRVLRLDRKAAGTKPARWIVEIGSLKVSLLETELTVLAPSPEAQRPPLIARADLASPVEARPEISLRGMRLEEALEALRRHIDGALLAGLRGFAVIHGKGNGILQKGVHDYLKNDNAVADYYFSRPEMGGFGRTEVVLKQEEGG